MNALTIPQIGSSGAGSPLSFGGSPLSFGGGGSPLSFNGNAGGMSPFGSTAGAFGSGAFNGSALSGLPQAQMQQQMLASNPQLQELQQINMMTNAFEMVQMMKMMQMLMACMQGIGSSGAGAGAGGVGSVGGGGGVAPIGGGASGSSATGSGSSAPSNSSSGTPNGGGAAAVALAQSKIGEQAQNVQMANYTHAGGVTNDCADFVSGVIANTEGFKKNSGDANVEQFQKDLVAQGWKPVSQGQAQPGDVAIILGGGVQHTELVSKAGATQDIGSNGTSQEAVSTDNVSSWASGVTYYHKG